MQNDFWVTPPRNTDATFETGPTNRDLLGTLGLGPTGSVARARFRLRTYLSKHPSIFLPLMHLRAAHRGHIVGRDTEIMIEGYPRSGNTFAVVAFEVAQARPVQIARHLHAPAHIVKGVRRGLPVLVVIRDPVDAITSQVIRHPGLRVEDCLAAYVSFHSSLLPYLDQLVVGPFDRITSEFGSVIDTLNRRFGTNFRRFEHGPDSQSAVFAVIDQMDQADLTKRSRRTSDTVARPTKEREMVKAGIAAVFQHPRMASQTHEARDLYRQILENAR